MRNRHSRTELTVSAARDICRTMTYAVPNARDSNGTTPGGAVGPADKAPIRTFTALSNRLARRFSTFPDARAPISENWS